MLWGGREGYESPAEYGFAPSASKLAASRRWWLSTNTKRVSPWHAALSNLKPQEPTKHQYDYDVATVYGFLKQFGWKRDQGEH